MKNFTNNFKQFTSRLGARWLIMALMLLLGTSSAWAANNVAGGYVYFDNTKTGWSDAYIQFVIGHSTFSRTYTMTKITNTNLYYVNLSSSTYHDWSNATYYAVIGTGSKWGDGNWGSNNLTNATHRTAAYTTKYDMDGDTKRHLIVPSTSSNGTAISVVYQGTSYSNVNKKVTVYVYNAAAGSSTYSASSAAGTAKVSGYYLSDNSTAATRSASTTLNSTNTANNTFIPGITLTATAASGYKFVGWYSSTSATTAVSTDATFSTSHEGSDKTYYARFEKLATITYNANGKTASNMPSNQTVASDYTVTLSSNTPTASGYTFIGWNTSANGTGTSYAKGAKLTNVKSNITLYAQWEKACDDVAAPTLSIDRGITNNCGDITTGIIAITNYAQFSNCTFTLNGKAVTPTNAGKIEGVTTSGSCTVVVTNNCGNSSEPVSIDMPKTTVKAPTVYDVSLTYPQVSFATNTGGVNIYLAQSERDVTYYLYKNGTKVTGSDTQGDGRALVWSVLESGTYTVKADNPCNAGVIDMNGSVEFTCMSNLELAFEGGKSTFCPGETANVIVTFTGTGKGDEDTNPGKYGWQWTTDNITYTSVYLTESDVKVPVTIKGDGSISLSVRSCNGTVNSNELEFTVTPAPEIGVKVVQDIVKCGNDITQYGEIQITGYNPAYTYKIGNDVVEPNNEGIIDNLSSAGTFTLYAINSCNTQTPVQFTISSTDNKPTITGNTSFQPNGSTTLTSDKGESTTWVALDGGDITDPKTNPKTGTSIEFTAKENGTYHVQATYNGCSTTVEIKVQDDLYVWVRRPIKNETAYDQFYHKDQNSEQGGDLFYNEFASLPGDYQQYNQGGKAAERTCTDKDGYKWYGFVVSKTAIENDYYFTVHAPNDKGYGGFHTHTYATQLVDMDADLYFVMDETPSNVNRGWNINTPVVVRASGDAMFNGNNFADFVPLYVKDANICDKEVVSFEWQKSASPNGTYTTYKSGKGINNIRTREAGWYRCVVTYGDGKGTATSNAIQVTNSGGTAYSFTSNLPIVMVNTNGVGFPDECTVTGGKYPSAVADKMKEKISVDVIIKKGDQVLYDKKARMNYRGSSSLNFKKKSYAFVSGQDSCVFDKSRHDYVKTKKAKMLNILGLDYEANDKDWVMYAATADPSMIRNRLVFDLYQKMRPDDWGVHSTYVELVVDGEYKGVYVFMDKITANEKRVNIVDGTGFIVKWDKTDVADRYVNGNDEESDEKTFATSRTGKKGISTYGTTVDQLFEIEYPEKEDIVDAGGSWSGTVETIKQRFEDFETALEAKNYEQVRAIIDYDSWADWFILNEYTKNLDAYRASCIFTCKGQGYKIQAVPLWDQELSFNNAAANISGKGANSTSGLLIQNGGVYSDAFPAPFWFTGGGTSITGGLLNDPCFISLVKEKWATYTADGGVLTSAKINDMVDAYKADLGAIGTAGTPIYRENAMIPFNNSTNAGRGATSSCTGSQAIGYFGYGENCGSAVSHDNSITAIKNWIPARITGLTSALEPLEGEALIFLVSPATQDVTPWQTALVSVQAPSGYTYDIDYSAITAAGGEVTVNNNTYSIKLPRPDGWAIGGNGDDELSHPYEISASIEIEDEGNTCGVSSPGGEDTKTATIVLKDEIENCTPEVTK